VSRVLLALAHARPLRKIKYRDALGLTFIVCNTGSSIIIISSTSCDSPPVSLSLSLPLPLSLSLSLPPSHPPVSSPSPPLFSLVLDTLRLERGAFLAPFFAARADTRRHAGLYPLSRYIITFIPVVIFCDRRVPSGEIDVDRFFSRGSVQRPRMSIAS